MQAFREARQTQPCAEEISVGIDGNFRQRTIAESFIACRSVPAKPRHDRDSGPGDGGVAEVG